MTSVFSWIAAVSIISPFILTGQNAKEDYAKIAKELDVKELMHATTCRTLGIG